MSFSEAASDPRFASLSSVRRALKAANLSTSTDDATGDERFRILSARLTSHLYDVGEFAVDPRTRKFKKSPPKDATPSTYACFWAGNGGNGGVLAQASGECWRDCFVQPDGGRWSNLICSHRADVLAIFRNDTARRVKTYPRARQKVCAANVRREGEPSFG